MFITFKNGQAFTQYNKIGIHFERNKLITTSADANLPTLLKIQTLAGPMKSGISFIVYQSLLKHAGF